MAFSTWPRPAKAAMAVRPATMSAKYSADQKVLANSARGPANRVKRTAPMVPPAKEEIAAMVKALPALPWRAMG